LEEIKNVGKMKSMNYCLFMFGVSSASLLATFCIFAMEGTEAGKWMKVDG
jgi:hypothetical protein